MFILCILFQFKVKQKLVGHTEPVTSLDATYVPVGDQGEQFYRTVIVSSSVDSSVKVWRRKPGSGQFCTITITTSCVF